MVSTVLAVVARASRVECFAATTASVLSEPQASLKRLWLTRGFSLQVRRRIGGVRWQLWQCLHDLLATHLPPFPEEILPFRFSSLAFVRRKLLTGYDFGCPLHTLAPLSVSFPLHSDEIRNASHNAMDIYH